MISVGSTISCTNPMRWCVSTGGFLGFIESLGRHSPLRPNRRTPMKTTALLAGQSFCRHRRQGDIRNCLGPMSKLNLTGHQAALPSLSTFVGACSPWLSWGCSFLSARTRVAARARIIVSQCQRFFQRFFASDAGWSDDVLSNECSRYNEWMFFSMLRPEKGMNKDYALWWSMGRNDDETKPYFHDDRLATRPSSSNV